jgi:hypothetical protein
MELKTNVSLSANPESHLPVIASEAWQSRKENSCIKRAYSQFQKLKIED